MCHDASWCVFLRNLPSRLPNSLSPKKQLSFSSPFYFTCFPHHLLQTPATFSTHYPVQIPLPLTPTAHAAAISSPSPKNLSRQARMPTPTPNLLFLLLLLFLAATSSCSQVRDADADAGVRMVPMAGGAGFSGVVLNETRRRLGSFQLCAPCTCCGGPKGVCVLSPCCYAINCNIPNRPFGFCSFTPKSCDCLGCNL